MGRSDSRSLTFWTLEEYEKFLASIDKDSRYYVLFETLFWTGMRIGELLALTKEDVDLKNNQININKTFYRTGGKDIIIVIGLGDLLCKAAQRIDLLQLAVNPLVKPIGLTKKFLCCHFRTSSCALTASISAVCVLSLR